MISFVTVGIFDESITALVLWDDPRKVVQAAVFGRVQIDGFLGKVEALQNKIQNCSSQKYQNEME